jgi:amino acid permease
MKKISSLIVLIATAILSGVALSRFLNWAGQIEIFDFDLDENIDNEEL